MSYPVEQCNRNCLPFELKVEVTDPNMGARLSIEEEIDPLSIKTLTGINNPDLGLIFIELLSRSSFKISPSNACRVNALVASFGEFAPKDITESMLVSQLTALHFQIMDLMRRIVVVDHSDLKNGYLNMATKFMRAFSAQLEALRKYRQKGLQKMVVEHVNVHSGGQAVIGPVTTQGGDKNG